MIFCFDLDGTIGTNPIYYGNIMRDLMQIGHTVIVLTAAAGELNLKDRPDEVMKRLNKLQLFLHSEFSQLICCESIDKGKICKQLNANFIIDDSDCVVESVKRESPKTIVWKVI